MKFSDLANPAAAAEVIKRFQKRFKAKTCLAPNGDCDGHIVSAHTLSAEGMLRPIARDGHVYAIKTNLFNPGPQGPASIDLLGIRDTSVFNGFCARHDKELFSCIEDEPFTCTPKQLFMHAYRALAKECYLKRKQAESLPTLDQVKSVHGIPEELALQLSDDAILYLAASLRGAEEIERAKEKMDSHLLDGSWNRVITTVVPFAKCPTVVCSFPYSPDHDFEGRYLQDFEDLENDLSQLMVTIVPTSSGGFAGFALLSHLDTANPAPLRLTESLVAQADLTSSLLWLVFCQTENFAISPVWYESLPDQSRNSILNASFSNVDAFDSKHNQLKDCALQVASWEPGKPFRM